MLLARRLARKSAPALRACSRGVATLQKDVVIVGGGPAGLTLAAALRSQPQTSHLDIAVIEGGPIGSKLRNWAAEATPDHWENRVSSITPQSSEFLKRIGAWEHLVTDRTMPYDEMRVWDGISGAAIDFDAFSSESGIVATMVENANLQQALLARVDELSPNGSPFIDGHKVAKITTDSTTGWPVVHLDGEPEQAPLSCRLLVGADGQMSPVRQYAGIETHGWDYGRMGIVAAIRLEYDSFRTCAFQRFLRTGPVAMLPMPDGYATLVWSTTPERAAWLKQLPADTFVAMVNAAFRLDMADLDYLHGLDPSAPEEILDQVNWRLDTWLKEDSTGSSPDLVQDTLPVDVAEVQAGSVAAFPLKMRHVDSYTGDRVALVGDAAHTTHPLAGQGLNMGQRDVSALSRTIAAAAERGLDIGSSLALEPFPREVYAQNHMTIGAADKMHKLYSTDFEPIVGLRSLGLELVNMSSTAKSFLMGMASK